MELPKARMDKFIIQCQYLVGHHNVDLPLLNILLSSKSLQYIVQTIEMCVEL